MKEFKITCIKCGSHKVSLSVSVIGSITDNEYSEEINLKCDECGNSEASE